MSVTETVRQQARRLFTSADAEEVIATFNATELPLIANNGERVCLASCCFRAGTWSVFTGNCGRPKLTGGIRS